MNKTQIYCIGHAAAEARAIAVEFYDYFYKSFLTYDINKKANNITIHNQTTLSTPNHAKKHISLPEPPNPHIHQSKHSIK